MQLEQRLNFNYKKCKGTRSLAAKRSPKSFIRAQIIRKLTSDFITTLKQAKLTEQHPKWIQVPLPTTQARSQKTKETPRTKNKIRGRFRKEKAEKDRYTSKNNYKYTYACKVRIIIITLLYSVQMLF
jgi:hypothetical protein